MENEIEINGVKYRKVIDQAPELLKVGDWVEAVKNDGIGRFKIGAQGTVKRVWNNGVDVDWCVGEFDAFRDAYQQAWLWEIKKIDPLQKTPALKLKYKVGDIVVVALRVVEIDKYDDDLPYGLEFVADPDSDLEVWASKEALEPDRPEVGDEVIAIRDARFVEGILNADDGSSTLPFRVNGLWCTDAIKVE